ncbi:MAG: tetratricopeptide repeat protein [Nitrospira sp.]|nr:tetratricopeptide repeat protein [Nitrospira sp.]
MFKTSSAIQKGKSRTRTMPGGHSPHGGTPSTHTRAFPVAIEALVLCLLVAVSYFPATMAGFVLDDNALTDARPVRTWDGIWHIWFQPGSLKQSEGHYWPVLYSTFWLEHKLWGFAPAGYHTVNLLLHSGVTLLLWRLLRRLAVPGAWVAAAVFAVHPLHVESVAWVIGRKDLLAALLYLSAVLGYIRFVEDGRWGRYLLALPLFVLSLLSKSVVVTLPASLLIWHWWKQGRVTRTDVARVAPFVLVGLGVTVTDWMFYKSLENVSFDYSWIERVQIAAHALWFYVGKLVWPTELAIIYPHWYVSAGDPLAWGYILAAGGVAAALWASRRRIGRGPLAGALFFAVTLSPTLGFVDYGYMRFSFVAERYQYLAGIGVIVTVVGTAAYGARRLSGARRTGVQAVVVAVLVVLGALSWQHSEIYQNKFTYYRHIIALNPEARFAHFGLGNWYSDQGRHEEALAAYHNGYQAARKHPSDKDWVGFTLSSIGRASEALGRFDQAEAYYRRALEINPRPATINNLGAMWFKQQRYQDALILFQSAVSSSPGYAKGHSGVGVALYGLHRYEEALQSFERALALDPFLEEAQNNRALALDALREQGNTDH